MLQNIRDGNLRLYRSIPIEKDEKGAMFWRDDSGKKRRDIREADGTHLGSAKGDTGLPMSEALDVMRNVSATYNKDMRSADKRGADKRSADKRGGGKRPAGARDMNPWIAATLRAKEELGITGFHAVKKGTEVYKLAKKYHAEEKSRGQIGGGGDARPRQEQRAMQQFEAANELLETGELAAGVAALTEVVRTLGGAAAAENVWPREVVDNWCRELRLLEREAARQGKHTPEMAAAADGFHRLCGGARGEGLRGGECDAECKACDVDAEISDKLRCVSRTAEGSGKLLQMAQQDEGEGGLLEPAQVYEVTAPGVVVYRAFNESVPDSQFGNYWSFEQPEGTAVDHRRRYVVCPSWSPLDGLVSAELVEGARIVVGGGQSAVCRKPAKGRAGLSFAAQPNVQQVFVVDPSQHLRNVRRYDQLSYPETTPDA